MSEEKNRLIQVSSQLKSLSIPKIIELYELGDPDVVGAIEEMRGYIDSIIDPITRLKNQCPELLLWEKDRKKMVKEGILLKIPTVNSETSREGTRREDVKEWLIRVLKKK